MGTLFQVDFKSWDVSQYQRTEKIVSRIDLLYTSMIEEAIKIGILGKRGGDKPFSFDAIPTTKAQIKRLQAIFAKRLSSIILEGQSDAWEFAARKNDKLLNYLFENSRIPKSVLERYRSRNIDSLKAFQSRKVNGLNLSDRIWNQMQQFKLEMEMSLDLGLGEGRSASELSRDIRGYLKEPDLLFRRVCDKRGKLHLSQRAKSYHPGQGVYRSSYKNAMRVARSEVNMAYRESDFERWQQMDFIVGIEVRLSSNHPIKDICDELAGSYPKNFKFTSWHPHCRCHAIPILATEQEINQLERILLNGGDSSRFKSRREVVGAPSHFRSWVAQNRERIERAKSKPYFIMQNPHYI